MVPKFLIVSTALRSEGQKSTKDGAFDANKLIAIELLELLLRVKLSRFWLAISLFQTRFVIPRTFAHRFRDVS